MPLGTPPWRDGEPPVACPKGCGRTVHWNPCETAETELLSDAQQRHADEQRKQREPRP